MSALSGFRNIDHALIGGPSESQGNVFFIQFEFPIHQHVRHRQDGIRIFTMTSRIVRIRQFLIGVSGIDPDILIRQFRLDSLHERTKFFLVHNFHRLPAKKSKTFNVRELAFLYQFILYVLVKFFSVIKIPCHLIKAAVAMMRASRNKQGCTASRPVRNVTHKYLCIVHVLTSVRERPVIRSRLLLNIDDLLFFLVRLAKCRNLIIHFCDRVVFT